MNSSPQILPSRSLRPLRERSSNSIGSGARLVALSVPMDEPGVWGRLAGRMSVRSAGTFLRQMALLGLEKLSLEHPCAEKQLLLRQAADEIRAIRRRYYGPALRVYGSVVLMAIFAVMVCDGMFSKQGVMQRASRKVREVRSVRCQVTGRETELDC